jgi:hypothetical protein
MKYLFLLFLISCNPVLEKQKLNSDEFYKRDIIITVNGETDEGAIVAKPASKYSFHIEARGDLDVFIMNSCHKEETKEKAWNVKTTIKSGLFGWGRKQIDSKREITFDYFPNELEKDDCPLQFTAVEEKGRHSWGYVDFENEFYKIKASVLCNGRTLEANGVSICQARAGLTQIIKFPEVVKSSAKNLCGLPAFEGQRFEFKMPKGKCTLVFKGASNEFFKINLLGYEGLVLREL